MVRHECKAVKRVLTTKQVVEHYLDVHDMSLVTNEFLKNLKSYEELNTMVEEYFKDDHFDKFYIAYLKHKGEIK